MLAAGEDEGRILTATIDNENRGGERRKMKNEAVLVKRNGGVQLARQRKCRESVAAADRWAGVAREKISPEAAATKEMKEEESMLTENAAGAPAVPVWTRRTRSLVACAVAISRTCRRLFTGRGCYSEPSVVCSVWRGQQTMTATDNERIWRKKTRMMATDGGFSLAGACSSLQCILI